MAGGPWDRWERCKGTTGGKLVGGTIVFFVGCGGVYERVTCEGLSGTTLGMTRSMVVKEVLMDSYGKISSWKTTSRLVKTWWVSTSYNL